MPPMGGSCHISSLNFSPAPKGGKDCTCSAHLTKVFSRINNSTQRRNCKLIKADHQSFFLSTQTSALSASTHRQTTCCLGQLKYHSDTCLPLPCCDKATTAAFLWQTHQHTYCSLWRCQTQLLMLRTRSHRRHPQQQLQTKMMAQAMQQQKHRVVKGTVVANRQAWSVR